MGSGSWRSSGFESWEVPCPQSSHCIDGAKERAGDSDVPSETGRAGVLVWFWQAQHRKELPRGCPFPESHSEGTASFLPDEMWMHSEEKNQYYQERCLKNGLPGKQQGSPGLTAGVKERGLLSCPSPPSSQPRQGRGQGAALPGKARAPPDDGRLGGRK